MRKWIAACMSALLILGLCNLNVFADSLLKGETVSAVQEVVKQEGSPILTKPQDIFYVTTSDKILLSGAGKEGDRVTITLYEKAKDANHYTSLGEPLELTIGALEIFTREISLNPENSVVVKNSSSSNKEPLLVWVTLVRGKTILQDLRFIKCSDKEDLKKNLENESRYKSSLGQ